MNLPIDRSVVYDIINSRMISSQEQIVFVVRKSACFDDEDITYYKVITVDTSGVVRKYYKECRPGETWHKIQTL